MKTLSEYIIEKSVIQKKTSKAELKKIATDWARKHVTNEGGRCKIVPESDGTFTIVYDNTKSRSKLYIKMTNNIPDFIRFDVNCENLYLSGKNNNIFHYFNRLNVGTCMCNISGSLGDVRSDSETVKISHLEFENTPGLKSGNMNNVEISKVYVRHAGDYSFLAGIKGINVTAYLEDCGSIQVDFNGLDIDTLIVEAETQRKTTLTIKGKYNLKNVSRTWWTIIDGYIPPKIESYDGDHLGSMISHIKEIDTLYAGAFQIGGSNDIETLQRFLSGDLKIKTIRHYQSPYAEISKDEFILSMQSDIAYKRGYKQSFKPIWPQYDLEVNDFHKWKETQTQFDVIEDRASLANKERKSYIICDKKTRVPIGIYYEIVPGPWLHDVLYTNDKELLISALSSN